MMHKAWCNVEDVPYYFSWSSIKFQGHTGWKMNDLTPVSVRLLGRSQLPNPSDLPCYDQTPFWPSNSRWSPSTISNLNVYMPIQVTYAYDIWIRSKSCWNIFDRLFLLSGVRIWSNFDLGIQDGHHPPFWISWIFYPYKLYACDISNETNSTLWSHFYTLYDVIGYDNVGIWPWIKKMRSYAMPNFHGCFHCSSNIHVTHEWD